MCYQLLFLTGLVAAGLAGLMGALHYPPSPPVATLALPPNAPDAVAEQTLDRAIAAMAPERLGCLETKLWHKVTLPNLTYEAKGRYLLGPEQRFRLELHAKMGGAVSTQLAVGDGVTVWEASRIGGGEWDRVTKLDWKPVVAALDNSGKGDFMRWDFLQGRHFGGVASMLRSLQSRMNWVKIEKVQRAGKARLRLAGVWKADFVQYMKTEQTWPAGLPQQCRLELDPLTLWPHRLEWWGPAVEGAANTLLAQLEFRDPVVHTALAPERCAKEFTFNPGNAAVVDQTEAVKAEYKAKFAGE